LEQNSPIALLRIGVNKVGIGD